MRPKFIAQIGGASPGRGFYRSLVSATLTDNSGEEADTLTMRFDDRLNALATPPEGAIIQPFYGYQETGVTSCGLFTVAGIGIEGGPDGEFLTVEARAADIREDLKQRMDEHFEDTDLGTMLNTVFGRHKLDVEIDPELASIKIDYEARFNQSAFGFATNLARRYGAVAKPGGGKMVFVKKGNGAKRLPVIWVHKNQCSDWNFDLEPRPRHGRVVAKWFDRSKGELKFETVQTGKQGPMMSLQHTFGSQAEAKKAAEAEGVSQNRKTGSGAFSMAGWPFATAEADTIASGFRSDINGKWRTTTVTHDYSQEGYITTIDVEAPEEQKGGKK